MPIEIIGPVAHAGAPPFGSERLGEQGDDTRRSIHGIIAQFRWPKADQFRQFGFAIEDFAVCGVVGSVRRVFGVPSALWVGHEMLRGSVRSFALLRRAGMERCAISFVRV
jgi:hypothetical protein